MAPEDFDDYLKINKKHWNVWARRDWPYKKEWFEQIRNGSPFIEEVEPKLCIAIGQAEKGIAHALNSEAKYNVLQTRTMGKDRCIIAIEI